MKKSEKLKFLYVEWGDAIVMDKGWYSQELAIEWGKNEDWIIRQAGYLISENDRYILLASKYNPQESEESKFSGITKIPKGWIRKKKTISSFV